MTDSIAEEFIAGRTDRYDPTPRRPSRDRNTYASPPSSTVFPSFYDAVHRAWNAWVALTGNDTIAKPCDDVPGPYEPDLHRCYELAGLLRVELHAAGIALSSDLGSSGARHLSEPYGEDDGLQRVLDKLRAPDVNRPVLLEDAKSIGLFGVEPGPGHNVACAFDCQGVYDSAECFTGVCYAELESDCDFCRVHFEYDDDSIDDEPEVPGNGSIEQAQQFTADDETAWREAIARSEQQLMVLGEPYGGLIGEDELRRREGLLPDEKRSIWQRIAAALGF